MKGFSRTACASLLLGILAIGIQTTFAQPPGRQIDGTIDRIQDGTVYLNTAAAFPINDATRVTRINYGSVNDLTAGRYISLSARPAEGGMLEASVVGLFAEGVTPNEGQRELAEIRFCQPNCRERDLMTNAAINDAVVDQVSGGQLMISFAGQSSTVVLTPQTRIELQSVGSLSDITQGANVLGFINDENNAASVWVYLD
jgi:hypothetical protein